MDEAWEGAERLHYGVALSQGPREAMEDVVQVVPDAHYGFLFAAVFDGHAGIDAATYLEQHLYHIFDGLLQKHTCGLGNTLRLPHLEESGLFTPLGLQRLMNDLFEKVDAELIKTLSRHGDAALRGSGASATTVLVRADQAVVANVGDSHAVLSRAGRAVDLSVEHRVYGRGEVVLRETERVEQAGGWIHDGRVCGLLAVSRAFGDADFKGPGLKRMLQHGVDAGFWDRDFADRQSFTADPVIADPDVTELALQPDDEFIIIASDGLWDVLPSQDAVQLARRALQAGQTPQEAAEKLVAVALKRRTSDNVSVVCIDLVGSRPGGWVANGAPKKKSGGLLGMFG